MSVPTCPSCHSELPKPPEDVQDWFRCQTCGTPLQISTTVGKIIFGLSVGLLLIAFWGVVAIIPLIPQLKYLSGFGLKIYLGSAATGVGAIYAFLVRLLWKSKLFQPRPCDPYSSLNLSDDRKKMRGNP